MYCGIYMRTWQYTHIHTHTHTHTNTHTHTYIHTNVWSSALIWTHWLVRGHTFVCVSWSHSHVSMRVMIIFICLQKIQLCVCTTHQRVFNDSIVCVHTNQCSKIQLYVSLTHFVTRLTDREWQWVSLVSSHKTHSLTNSLTHSLTHSLRDKIDRQRVSKSWLTHPQD